MVAIPNREELEPRISLRLGAMEKFVGSGKFAAKTAWYLIDHHGRVANDIVPKIPANLLLSDKSSCYGDAGTPCVLGKTVG